MWALIESGEKGLDKEIASVKASANSTQDSYIVALGANILPPPAIAPGRAVDGQTRQESGRRRQRQWRRHEHHALRRRRSRYRDHGAFRAGLDARTRLCGECRERFEWIVESNKSGRFGSTQSTILALRAIVAYDAAHARPKAPGSDRSDGRRQECWRTARFHGEHQGALVLPEFAGELGPGKHTVALRMEDGSSMPFSISVKYYSTLPDSSEQTQIGIHVALKDRQIQEGGVTEAIVSIANKSDQAIPTPVAIVGIPGGLEVRHDQLKELVKSGKIDAYEVIGREVVLYWRYLKANDKFDLPLSLVAAVPGSYTGPPAAPTSTTRMNTRTGRRD